MSPNTFAGLEKKARQIRREILEMCIGAGTGHVTSSLSCTELLVALYHGGILNFDVAKPGWADRDRFILSKGQASPGLYVVLADLGFIPKDTTRGFCRADGIFGVHLQHDVAGVEMTAGSLGHGLGVGAGIALAARLDRQQHLTFVLLGDAECQEGSIWESAMFAGHHQLNNLVAIVDRNWLGVIDFTENSVRLNPFESKWAAFGWNVKTIDGHSFEEIFAALSSVRSRRLSMPTVIIANTTKGKGVSFLENQPSWHGLAPRGKQAELAIAELAGKESR